MRKLRKGLLLAVAMLAVLAMCSTALASGASGTVTVKAEASATTWQLGTTQPLPTIRVTSSSTATTLSYQWYQGQDGSGTRLENQTGSTLQLTSQMLGTTVGADVRFYCVVTSSDSSLTISPSSPSASIRVTGPQLKDPESAVSVNPFAETPSITLGWENSLQPSLAGSGSSAAWTCVAASEPGTVATAPAITTSSAMVTATSVSGQVSRIPWLRAGATYTYDVKVTLADGSTVEKKGVKISVTPVANQPCRLDQPATWIGSDGISIETADGGATYYAACRPDAFQENQDEQLVVSTTAITIQTASEYFSVLPEYIGRIRISARTPIGVYTLQVQSQERTGTVTIAVQGTLTATESQNLQPNGTASLQAALGPASRLPSPEPTNISWEWVATDHLTVAKDTSTGPKSQATLTVAATAPDGRGTVSVTPTQGGIPLAKTAEISIQIADLSKPRIRGISVYEMPNNQEPMAAGEPLLANGRQYQLKANWSKDPTGTWSYMWSVTRPAGSTGTGTAPAISSQTGSSSVWFIPNTGNIGAWTVTVLATSRTGETSEASAAIRIDRATEGPGIAAYLPLSTELMASPGESLSFAITPSAGTDAQGDRVAGGVFWVERTRDKETFQFTPASTYICIMPRDGSLTVTGYVAPAGTTPSDPSELVGKPSVSWSVAPSSPQPVINGSLSIEPYAGTIVTDADSRTPAARISIGGYATFGVALIGTNDPEDFVFTWETRPNSTSAWQSAQSFAGMVGQQYTTPLMTLAMDSSQYRVRVTNTDDSTLEAISSAVSLVVDSTELTPKVTISSTNPPLNTYQNPQTITVGEGANVTMQADVDLPYGVECSLQWWRANRLETGQSEYSWQRINGATSDTYTLRGARGMDDGDLYRCVATVNYSSGLMGTSDPVRIIVEDEEGWVTVDSVLVNGEPADLVAYSPADPPDLSVEAAALDGGTLGYQWYMNRSNTGNVKIDGATSATYTPMSLDASGTYAIWCEVSNTNDPSVPAIASNSVTLVYPRAATRPTISTQPNARYDATPGETVSIDVKAWVESGDTLSYAWQSAPWQTDAWASIAQATGPTLRLPSVPLSYNGRQYRCVVTNTATSESTVSSVATLFVFDSTAYLRVSAPPAETISTLPMIDGTSISAAVQVTASQDLSRYTYEWQYSPTQSGAYEATSATGQLAVLPATSTAQGDYVINVPLELAPDGVPIPTGYYRLSVTNVGSSDQGIYAISISDPGFVLVSRDHVPYVTRQPQDQTVTQGNTATFSLSAAVPEGRPLFRWQKWSYGSAAGNVDDKPPEPGLMGYWANCDTGDGAGVNTNSFTTTRTDAEMRLASYYEHPIFYRCLVYDAESGNVTTSLPCHLTVTQSEPRVPAIVVSPDADLTFSGTEDNRQLDGLTATSAGTTVAEVVAEMQPPRRGTIVILDKDGHVRTADELVCTGDYIAIQMPDGSFVSRAVIIVRGDIMGTGRMNLVQLVTASKAMLGEIELTGPYLKAIDSGDGNVTLVDLVAEAALYREATGFDPADPDTPTDPDEPTGPDNPVGPDERK